MLLGLCSLVVGQDPYSLQVSLAMEMKTIYWTVETYRLEFINALATILMLVCGVQVCNVGRV